MTDDVFSAVVDARLSEIMNLMGMKGVEYARNGDRLSNFKKAAGMLGKTPETALVGMWVKHLVSVADMVGDLEQGITHSSEKWDEKLNDTIIYTLLLDGLLHERAAG